MADRA